MSNCSLSHTQLSRSPIGNGCSMQLTEPIGARRRSELIPPMGCHRSETGRTSESRDETVDDRDRLIAGDGDGPYLRDLIEEDF